MYVLFLITVFVTLFEEEKWPDDPIEYAREFFKATPQEEIDQAIELNQKLKAELEQLNAQIAEAQAKLDEAEE